MYVTYRFDAFKITKDPTEQREHAEAECREGHDDNDENGRRCDTQRHDPCEPSKDRRIPSVYNKYNFYNWIKN